MQAQEQQFQQAGSVCTEQAPTAPIALESISACTAFKQGIGGMRSTSPDPFGHDDEPMRKELAREIRDSDSPATYIRFLGVTEPDQLNKYKEFNGISDLL